VNPYNRIAEIVDRIGFTGGANRAREHDAYRIEVNGGPPPSLELRFEAVATRLENIAEDLEARLA
jgi:hypothetical protein